MIVSQTVNGRPATVGYFKGNFEPCDEADAGFAKVNFEDEEGGAVILILPATVADYNENHDPKTGEFSEGGGPGGGGGTSPGVRSNGTPIKVTGGPKYRAAEMRNSLSLLPQEHLDMFPGAISLTSKNVDNSPNVMGVFSRSTNAIELSTEFAQMEETLLHEMGHAHDVNSPRVNGQSPSMRLWSGIHTEAQTGMTAKELKAAHYWMGSNIEAYAELYSLSYSRPRTETRSYGPREPKFFGGMSRDRALSVFSKSVKLLKG